MLSYLFMKSLGAGIGAFIGTLIGLGIRSRKGSSAGLLAGSVVLTALTCGLLAQIVMMFITYLRMPT